MDKKLSEDLALVGCVGVGGVTSEEADNMNYVELAKAGGRKGRIDNPCTCVLNSYSRQFML